MGTLFDPQGRISPAQFQESALILIAIGAVVGMVPYFFPGATMWTMISIVLLYPWVVIWIKRLHDAGKPGWIFVPILIVYLAISWTAAYFVGNYFAPQTGPTPTEFAAAMEQASLRAETTAIPTVIVSVLISVAFVFIANALLKSDPGPNAYDPPDHMR